MEILDISIHMKDGALLPWYPSENLPVDYDISVFKDFCTWALRSADDVGTIDLGESAYSFATDLLGTDDLCCPSVLRIRLKHDQKVHCISIPFNREAYVAKLYEEMENYDYNAAYITKI